MDPEQLSRELLRALRGHRSQPAFSRRLGYRSNVAYTWESGRRWPTAVEALRAAARAGVDVRGAFARFYRVPPDWLATEEPDSPAFVARFLQDQQGRTPIVTIAARAGVNRFSVARWIAGDVVPRLPDFLRVVEASSLRLVDLLAALVDPALLPSAHEAWLRREAQRTMALEEPWTQAVLRCLEVEGAPNAVEDIAARLVLDPALVARCLDALERAGQARRVGARWHPVQVETVDTRRTEETARKMKGFWAQVGLDHLAAGREGLYAYNVFAVSHDQYRRLAELHDAYYRALRTLIAEEAPPERVALVNIQLLRLDDGPLGGEGRRE